MNTNFQQFETLKEVLANYLQEVANYWGDLEPQNERSSDGTQNMLIARKFALENDAFRIMTVGEFSRGKSTLINAIFGREILPQSVVPCTPLVTQIKYGKDEIVKLYRENDANSTQTMSLEEFRQNFTLKNKNSIQFSDIESIEISVNMDIARNGIIFVDSPGLNENSDRARNTINYLRKYADATLFLLKANQIITNTELEFIDQYFNGEYMKNVFFVVNYWDTMRNDTDGQQDIKERVQELLVTKRLADKNRIIYISSSEALNGRMNNNISLINQSGISMLEQEVFRFLQEDRAKAKLIPPKRELLISIAKAMKLIEDKRKLHRMSKENFEKQFTEQHPALIKAEEQLTRLTDSVERAIGAYKQRMNDHLGTFISTQTQMISSIIDKIDFSFTDYYTKKDKNLNNEIATKITKPCKDALTEFIAQLERSGKQERERLKTEIEAELRQISSQLGKLSFSSYVVQQSESSYSYKESPSSSETSTTVLMGIIQIIADGAVTALDLIPGIGILLRVAKYAMDVSLHYKSSRKEVKDLVLARHIQFITEHANMAMKVATDQFDKFAKTINEGIAREVLPQIHIMRNLLENIKIQKQDNSFKIDAELQKLTDIEHRIESIGKDLTQGVFSKIQAVQ